MGGGGGIGGIANDVFNPIGAIIGQGVKAIGGNQLAQNITDPIGGAISTGQNVFSTQPVGPLQPVGFGSGGQAPGSTFSPGLSSGPLNFSYQGMPGNFPSGALPEAYQNISNLYGYLGNIAPGYYGNAQNATTGAQNQGVGAINDIYGGGLGTQQALTQSLLPQAANLYGGAQGQIQGMENQNLGQVNNLLNNYNQSFVQQLGPQGQLGQQLMGEFNNYGLTPESGAFQSALGNQLGTLGAQNALTLGQQALQPGINAQYGTMSQGLGALSGLMSQGLGGQLSTAQQGTQQAGQLANLGGIQNMTLGSEGALSPLNYLNQAANMQGGIINQAAELPIQFWQSQNEANLAQSLQQQNLAAQNSASQMGLLGNVLGSGIGAGGMMLAAGK